MVTQHSNTSEVSEVSGDVAASLSQEQRKGADSCSSNKQQRAQVPSLQIGDAKGCTTEQETIFCLSELLKLQVSIAGSLEMACLAFRHADTDLSDAIRRTFWQARDLFSHAANVVSKYAEVAQQVGQLVLADLKLAVDEKEPSLAVSLLGMVKGWVANMKTGGEEIQRRYMGLQDAVHTLIQRAQHTKTDADRRLAEAVQAAEAELAPSLSPRTQQFLALAPHGPESAHSHRREDGIALGGAGNGGKCMSSSSSTTGAAATPAGAAATSETSNGTLNLPFSMNVWTRQLFEQLSQAQEGSGAKVAADNVGGDLPMIDSGADNEAWKRDVLDLLFMAPGITPSQVPKVEPLGLVPEVIPRARGPGSEGYGMAEEISSPTLKPKSSSVGSGAEDAAASSAGGRASAPVSCTAGMDDVVVRYIPTAAEKSAAEAVTHSSASLLRALRELKRVDEILHGCSAFWSNMDGTVQKLAQMKEHTETLVNFAANSKALKQRFEQRLGEYTNFWVSLERVCRQYCMDHQTASKRMYEVIREVADAADVLDTAQSARMGMVLAMRDKQLRHAGGMQF